MTLGCWTRAAARASVKKRSRSASSVGSEMNLTATGRSRTVSCASQTWPMLPRPSTRSSWYSSKRSGGTQSAWLVPIHPRLKHDPSVAGRRRPGESARAGAAEAEAGFTDLGIEPVVVGGTCAVGAVVPATATRYAAAPGRRALRIGLRGSRVGLVPVGGPLPDVAGHVEHAERARAVGKAPDRRSGRPAIVAIVQRLPRDRLARCHRDALGAAGIQPLRCRRLVAPRIAAAVAAACGVLPLGLTG